MSQTKLKLIALLLFTHLLAPTTTHAFSIKDAFCLKTENGTCKETVAGTFPSITSIISKSLLPNALLASGIILLFILTFGGFTIITAAGNPEKTQQGRQAITGAIIGFVIIFAAYWIIQIIEIITGIKILNPSI